MREEHIITGVTKLSKGRCQVEIDGELQFALYQGELRTYRIAEGEVISGEALEEIFSEVLVKRAKLRCMNLLKSRPYTEYQLKEKLRQGFYPDEAVIAALEYVKSFRYIDDRSYAKDYITYYSGSRSRGKITQDLLKKGIGKELVDEVYGEEPEEELPDESALIKRWLRKKNYDRESADYRERQKMGAFLYRKGFSADKIEKLL